MRPRRTGKRGVADSWEWATCFPAVKAATAHGDFVAGPNAVDCRHSESTSSGKDSPCAPSADSGREGLPLRRADWDAYLAWAVGSFRLAAIATLAADVLSIENARSANELLRVFRHHGYDQGIGPGVYDIHSPRVPATEEIVAGLRATLVVLAPAQVWVNPDCGLKTRRWEEVRPTLENVVDAAREAREAMIPARR